MTSFLHNLKKDFKELAIFSKIIYINFGIFLFFSILEVFSFMFQFNLSPILDRLYLPAQNSKLLSQPWTFITYMFMHNSFLHLLFNMLWLHFSGNIFLQYLNTKQLLSTYILGGISGGLIFIISYNYIPPLAIHTQSAQTLGASAAVLAVIVAIATYKPNYSVQFPIIGIVKLKHIAIFSIIIDLLSIPNGNSGGHIAHLGGALFGYLYVKQLEKGNDFSIRFSKWLNSLVNLFKPKPKFKSVNRRKTDIQFNTEKSAQQIAVDIVLEKISKSGYESLNKKEKETLFSASKQ